MGVHELRYLIAYGGDSGRALSEQGHGYLPLVMGAAVFLVGLAAGQLMRAVGRARRTGAGEGAAPGFASTWLLSAVALLLIFATQESLEGFLTAGHPAGLEALTAHGGLVALPLGVGVGALVALALRGAHAAVARATRARTRWRLRPPAIRRPVDPVIPAAQSPLARHLAGRAPPLLA
jgi:uncharacterized membrane protein